MKKEDYYIDLILNKCLSFEKTNSLLISYNYFNERFVQKIISKLPEKVTDIYLDCNEPFYEHELLSTLTREEIENCKYFNDGIYNKYAKKKACFLFLVSPVPGLMNDIDDEKLATVSKIKSESKKYFINKETSFAFPWAIVPVYNEYWEESLDINNLEEILYDICLVNKNSNNNWDKQITKSNKLVNKLNELQLDSLLFQNAKGTNLKVGLSKWYRFEGIGETDVLANLPSYEVFTSPDKNLTEGIVYSSKPLFYNGAIIDEFWVEFKDGKAINYKAKKGEKMLDYIINYDEGSSFLGEVALVENDSPISKTGIVFKTTLLDENASCHIALGRGYGDGSKKTLEKRGINFSGIHVDFMFGTDDMKVLGLKGKEEILIMDNGKFLL